MDSYYLLFESKNSGNTVETLDSCQELVNLTTSRASLQEVGPEMRGSSCCGIDFGQGSLNETLVGSNNANVWYI